MTATRDPRYWSPITIAPVVQAARIRAAVAFSGLQYREVARRVGISEATMEGRIRRRRQPSPATSMDELYAIADACGVPRTFMERGFDVQSDEDARLAQIEYRLRRLEEATA